MKRIAVTDKEREAHIETNCRARHRISDARMELRDSILTYFICHFLGEREFAIRMNNRVIDDKHRFKQVEVLRMAVSYINFLQNQLDKHLEHELKTNIWNTTGDIMTLNELIDREAEEWTT